MVRHGPGTDRTADFHAHHSPAGGLATFTIGRFAKHGGPGCELTAPAQSGVYAGYVDGERVHLLPFVALGESDRERYVHGKGDSDSPTRFFTAEEITRDYGWASDIWKAGDLRFEVLSPVPELPDPASASPVAQRDAFLPAVVAKLTLANPTAKPRTLVFGIDGGSDRWLPVPGLAGLHHRGGFGFATDAADAVTHIHFDPRSALLPNQFLGTKGTIAVAPVGMVTVTVPPGATRTITLALGWYKTGVVTIGRETKYWYTRLFSGIADVLRHALERSTAIAEHCAKRDRELAGAALNDEQRFLVAHSTRSYYGSTQLLDDGGRPRWIVNEGEYLMMNTFDLTVDMAFHELRFHPWSLANVLEQYATEYRYEDDIFDPAEPAKRVRGGVSFTHDMGVNNAFSPVGRSSYEADGLDRACFSHMTAEQLTNWVCCAGLYWSATNDEAFLLRHRGLLGECVESLLRRDHPEPAKRIGLPRMESGRTWPGGEITTYDSLDHSLGQARLNLYLAVKGWAAALALEAMLIAAGDPARAAEAAAHARRACDAVAARFDGNLGHIPAVLDGHGTSAIIPAIEGLIFPQRMGLSEAISEQGPYGSLIRALKRHHQAVLKPGVCLYDDGGWKLSSTADNSWMSKICLCQHVARTILGLPQSPADGARADRAHAQWERIGSADRACSDQFSSGVAKGSLYYPRIVTTVLWLDEAKATKSAVG